MPALVLQVLQTYANIVIIIFVGYYFVKLWSKEKELEEKDKKVDTEYHRVVNDALAKERKIIDDTTHEAEKIIAGAYYVNKATKEVVDHALEKMVTDIQNDAAAIAQEFMKQYQASLRDLGSQSLSGFQQVTHTQSDELQREIRGFHSALQESLSSFQTVAKGMERDLQEQIMAFHKTLLPAMQKELDEYKAQRMKQTEQLVTALIQRVSQEVLNKSFSGEDHQKLVIDALEKAKSEGLFT